MLAQKITFDLMQTKLDDIRVVQGDSCREIQFEGSDLDGVLSYEDYTYEFDLMKSDGTFVIQTLSAGVLIPSEQMEVITGTHYYSVKIKDADNELVYSGQGAFIVDDNVITEDAIESVAEVNGLVFPDDFLTKEDVGAVIDDATVSTDTTWSSEKISNQIDIIDDDTVSTDTTWSSDKISNQIDIIDDDTVSTDTTWSSDKIQDEIEINGGKHYYSTSEQVVGKWIDGSTLYERTFDRHLSPLAMSAYRWYAFDTINDSIHIIDAYGISVDNDVIDSYYPIVANYNNGDISIMHLRSGAQISMGYVTIRYTKE